MSILASTRRRLYVGVTNDVRRCVWEHLHGDQGSFTARYRVNKLVHVEAFADIRAAIAREKTLKRWRRERKERLVAVANAGWLDLRRDWFGTPSADTVDPGWSKTEETRS